MKKIVIAVLLIAAILIGGTGCMLNKLFNQSKTRNANELALSYMEKKYGEPFAYAAPYGNSLSGIKEILVTCDSLPEQKVLVQVENFESNERVFRDNYLAVKYTEETIAFFKECAAEQGLNANVFYRATEDGQSENLKADASFEEFLADGRSEMVVLLEVRASEYTNQAQVDAVIQKMAATCGCMAITVLVMDDEIYGTMDRDALNDCISHQQYVAMAKGYVEEFQAGIKWYGEV